MSARDDARAGADLSGRAAIVTGGSSGIGYAVAERLLAAGAGVVIAGRDEAKLARAARALGGAVATVAADVARPESAERVVAAAVERFGRVDVLVNNAGTFRGRAFTEVPLEELDLFLGYLRGAFVLTQAAVRRMRAQGDGGAVVSVSTMLALRGVAGLPASAPVAAKGGLAALTASLAIELAPDEIRVNAVAPGTVLTPLVGDLDARGRAALDRLQPLGRHGLPRDVADAVLYLATARFVTGVVLPVDGGVTAAGDARAVPRGER